MSLGLFNCRLIQPVGDQLFFLSAVLPHRRQFGQACSVCLSRVLLGPDQREGAECLSFFLLRRILFWFSEGEAPLRAEEVHSHRFTQRIPPKIPNPAHRFCYRAIFSTSFSERDTPHNLKGISLDCGRVREFLE